jgi:hypothetical protein
MLDICNCWSQIRVNVLKSTYLLRADSIGSCRYRKRAGAEREGIEPGYRIEKEEIELSFITE